MSKRANSVVEDEHVPVLVLVECEDNVAQYRFKIRRELNQPLARACCRGPSELHLGGVGVVFVGSAKHVGQCQSLYTLLRSKKKPAQLNNDSDLVGFGVLTCEWCAGTTRPNIPTIAIGTSHALGSSFPAPSCQTRWAHIFEPA
jgi:hypothetical protein